MIEAYLSGEAIAFHIPSDRESPTIFYAHPINDQASKRWRYLKEWAEGKAKQTYFDDTIDRAMAAADRASEEERGFIASRIEKIENAPPAGATLTAQEDIRKFLGTMPAEPFGELILCLSGTIKLRDLLFRCDAVPEPSASAA